MKFLITIAISVSSGIQFLLAATAVDTANLAVLDHVLQTVKADAPGMVLAVSQHGKLIYEKSAGLASLEWRTPMPVDAVFEAASVSKQFTATTALHLIAEGKLGLDDDVHDYIKELPDYGKKMTIRHLLTMTSGLRDWRNTTYLMGNATFEKVYTHEEALEIICRQKRLNFDPGDQYSYSNTNYDLLSIIVYRITGVPFTDYSTEHILNPVGFEHAKWRSNALAIVDRRVDSYGFNKTTKTYQRADVLERTHGAAGMLVTARDLVKWADFWAAGGFGPVMDSLRVLRGQLNDGREIEYAAGGVMVKSNYGIREISHSGFIGGYRTWVAHYPAHGISVSCLTNDQSFTRKELNKALAALMGVIDTAETKKPANPNLLANIAGMYKGLNSSTGFEVKVADGCATIFGDTLFAGVGDTLMKDAIKYVFNSNGLTTYSADEWLNFKKVSGYQPDEQRLQALEGSYYCEDLQINIGINVIDGDLYAERKAGDRMKLVPTYEDGGEQAFYGVSKGLRTRFSFFEIEGGHYRLEVSAPRTEHFEFVYKP